MSIVKVRELYKTDGTNTDGKRGYTRYFMVESNTPNELQITVETANDGTVAIPQRGAYYSKAGQIDYSALVKSIKCVKDSKCPTTWDVEVSYDQIQGNNNNPSPPSKPSTPPGEDKRTRFPDIQWDWVERDELLEKDLSAQPQPIISSTGEPIIRYSKRKYQLITITLWDWYANNANILLYNDTVNQNAWWGGAAKTWKVNLNCRSSWEEFGKDAGGNPLYFCWFQKTYRFEYNPNTWDFRPVDTGLMRVKDSELPSPGGSFQGIPRPNQLQRVTDGHGVPVNHRVLLDHGNVNTSGVPNLLGPFTEYVSKNWSTIFPNNITIDITAL